MDNRSKRVIYISHCFLNANVIAQNVGSLRRFPALFPPIIKLLMESNVGIIQMPCPEKKVFGLIREKCGKKEMPIDEIKPETDRIAKRVAEDIQNYLTNGFKVLGILGKRGSPACGVHYSWDSASKGKLLEEPGYLFESLKNKLEKKSLDIPLVEYDKDDEIECLNEIRKILN